MHTARMEQRIQTAIQDVTVVSVPVSDQDRSRAFFVDGLGFELVSDSDAGGLHWVEVRPPGSSTSLTLVTWFPSMPAGSLKGLVLGTGDVWGAYRTLSARGVEFDHEPQEAFWGTYATFADPDGNSFVLAQSAGS
jgi:catechol 2,3-dioxygenase-like lactoylglutathione lyase family enzyme